MRTDPAAAGRPTWGEFTGAIIAAADAHDSDIVVLGKFGTRTRTARPLSGLAQRAARAVTLPLLVVSDPPPPGPPRRLLAAIDESPDADCVLDWTRFLATRFDAGVDLLCVVNQSLVGTVAVAASEPERRRAEQGLREAAQRWLDRKAAGLREAGLAVSTQSPVGEPAAEIVAAAGRTGADLTVIGRHGAGRLAHALLGSTASRVLRASDRSVLVVPAAAPP